MTDKYDSLNLSDEEYNDLKALPKEQRIKILDKMLGDATPSAEKVDVYGSMEDANSPSAKAKAMADKLYSKENVTKGAELAASMLGGGLPNIVSSGASKLAQFLGKVGQEAALGAAAAGPDNRTAGALTAGGASAAGQGLAKLLGATGDVSMQIAAGRKKYTPGVGTKLADEGLWGTKGMMADQTAARLKESGEALSKSASEIPGTPIDSSQIAQNVWDKVSKPRLSGVGIKPSSADLPELNQMANYVEDIASRGQLRGEGAVGYARAAGDRAYGLRDVAGASTPKQLAKLEQIELSNALKNADKTGKFAKEASRYSALKKAEKGLQEEVSLPRSAMGLASLPVTALPFVSVLPSTIGQAATKSSKVTQGLAEALAKAAVVKNKKEK
jgi:hypothetical protein